MHLHIHSHEEDCKKKKKRVLVSAQKPIGMCALQKGKSAMGRYC